MVFGWALAMVAGACGQVEETGFELRMEAGDERRVVVGLPDRCLEMRFAEEDTARRAAFALPLAGGGYVRLWVGDMRATAWVEKEKPWRAALRWNVWNFDGEGARENAYLNGRYVHEVFFTDYGRMAEGVFREKLRTMMREREDSLRTCGAGEAFVERERERLRWVRRSHLAAFAYYGGYGRERPLSDSTMTELREALVEDEGAWGIPEYPETVRRTLAFLAGMEAEDGSAYGRLLWVLRRATADYRDGRLVEEVVYRSVMDHVRTAGMEDMPEMDSIFRRSVRRADYLAAYEAAYGANRRLFRGQPAVAFTFEDGEGRRVSLSDFRGRYVYIDLWATWCGPCNAEIPALQRLEREFEGRNIAFVGISCDDSREAWRRFVDAKKLGGTQLFMGEDRSYMDSILCRGIPRFLLVDREGRFLDANMTRPSDPATAETLRALPGI